MTSSPREPMNRIGCSPVDQSFGCTYDQITQTKDLPQKVCLVRLGFERKWFKNVLDETNTVKTSLLHKQIGVKRNLRCTCSKVLWSSQQNSRQILVKFYFNRNIMNSISRNGSHVEENTFITNSLHLLLRSCYTAITNYGYSKKSTDPYNWVFQVTFV